MTDSRDFVTTPLMRQRLRRVGLVALVLAVVVVTSGVAIRWYDARQTRDWTEARAIPVVDVIRLQPGRAAGELVLPGNIRAFIDAPIYARVAGYLRSWTVDIGAPVHAGQVLATIETPELDQQLLQARADLATARANEALSATTAARWQRMLAADSVSRQEADEKSADHAARQAAVAAAEANVARLQATASFKSIVAPFDGTITARRTDIGALINPGAANGQELFRLADARRVRIYVEIPQAYAADLHPGSSARLVVPEHPDAPRSAVVKDIARAINEASRTMLVQLEAANPDGALLPGAYVDVHFPMESRGEAPRLPVSALIFRKDGLQVAVVDANGLVGLHKVSLGRDFGTEVEVTGGVGPDDRIIDNPPDGLDPGGTVRIAGSDHGEGRGDGPARATGP